MIRWRRSRYGKTQHQDDPHTGEAITPRRHAAEPREPPDAARNHNWV
jgi:hypothetical protein